MVSQGLKDKGVVLGAPERDGKEEGSMRAWKWTFKLPWVSSKAYDHPATALRGCTGLSSETLRDHTEKGTLVKNALLLCSLPF